VSNVLIRFRITPDGGESFVAASTSRDVLVWEKRGRDNSYSDLMRRQDMGPLYAIAHIAARRLGLYDGDLATFEATCDLEPLADEDEEDEGEEDPTRPAQ
jgi:hypothetical protein